MLGSRWLRIVIGIVIVALLITSSYLIAVRTTPGRAWLRDAMITRAAGLFDGRGRITVGQLTEIGFGHVVAENVALVDSAGVPVVFARHVTGTLDMRGLFEKSIHIGTLTLSDVTMDFAQSFKGPFNIAYIISGDTTKGPSTGPGFGDDIRIGTLRLNDAKLTMISPWAPHEMFTGDARDSVVQVRDSLHDIIHTPAGMLQRRVVTLDRVVAHDVIVTDPAKTPASLQLDTLRGTVSDPPVKVVNASGVLKWTGDSLQLSMPAIRLPASTGAATGTIAWNLPGPLRYDIRIDAKAGMSDLGWIWDALPETGKGSAMVRMRTLADPDDAEYILTELDVSAMESRITGDITVVTRPADLLLENVDLSFKPLGSDLLRRLSYDALPADVNGVFTGSLVAKRGGSLGDLRIDRLDARFADSNIPGAVSSARLSGTVAIGASPSARGARIENINLDLRSLRSLLSDSVAIDGRLTGSMQIASADLQSANLRSVDLTWVDADSNVSTVRGNAKVGYGSASPVVDVDLIFDPLSMLAIARIDSTIPLSSTLAGRLQATGKLSQFDWKVALAANSSGGIALAGDASYGSEKWSISGAGSISAFDVQGWFGAAGAPVTSLDGTVNISAFGTRAKDGAIALDTGRASVALIQLPARALPEFNLVASGLTTPARLVLDSATARMGGVSLDARGAIALDSTLTDTLSISARADSLTELRPELNRLALMLQPVDSSIAKSVQRLASDTLTGDFSVAGPLFGSLEGLDGTLTLGAREMQVGSIRVGRVFGSVRATDIFNRPFFEAAATADEINGIGAIRVSTAGFRVQQASPDSGRLTLDVTAQDTSHLVIRGAYARNGDAFAVTMDSLRFQSGDAMWRNSKTIRVVSDATGVHVDSLNILSSRRGRFSFAADIPLQGEIRGAMQLEQFPIGTATAFTLGTPLFAGSITGDIALAGTRIAPLLDWRIRADSLGMNGTFLPRITSDGTYADKTVVANALLADTLGGSMHAVARVPIDLSLDGADTRMLSDDLDAEITSDSLRLGALGFAISGVSEARGTLNGRLAVQGTFQRPVATGAMTLSGLTAKVDALGIRPVNGLLAVRAAQDSLILERFRFQSGNTSDTVSMTGAMRFASGQPATIEARMVANNAALARQRDGTKVDLTADLDLRGPLRQPVLTGSAFVPSANVIIDPLGATTALDLNSAGTRELLSQKELELANISSNSFAELGRYVSVSNARVNLGDEVWVRTPEASVQVTGGLAITSSGDRLALEGEVSANRGQYLLDLSVVQRSFTIDSGRIRFYGSPDIEPTLDISATNVVRVANGEEIPIRVHIGGTLEQPVLALSSASQLYASAPESEIISLLIFGAPTFALDSDRQRTVSTVTGVLLPTIGNAFQGTLQRLLPVFNTVQLNTAGGQAQDDLSLLSVLDNLSITAGVQLNRRTYLRINTGVCRGSAESASRGTSPYLGVAIEYRIAAGLSAQIGADPGTAPCTQLGGSAFSRLQYGFDLFREWIF